MLSDRTKESILEGIRQQVARSLSDSSVYLDYASREERKFCALATVFPFPIDTFDENTTEGALVLNRSILSLSRLISDYVTSRFGTDDEVAAVGIHEDVLIEEDPSYFEPVFGDMPKDYFSFALVIYVRFVPKTMRVVPHAFGILENDNLEMEYLDHQLDKPRFDPFEPEE